MGFYMSFIALGISLPCRSARQFHPSHPLPSLPVHSKSQLRCKTYLAGHMSCSGLNLSLVCPTCLLAAALGPVCAAGHAAAGTLCHLGTAWHEAACGEAGAGAAGCSGRRAGSGWDSGACGLWQHGRTGGRGGGAAAAEWRGGSEGGWVGWAGGQGGGADGVGLGVCDIGNRSKAALPAQPGGSLLSPVFL